MAREGRFRFWHQTDMSLEQSDVRYPGMNGPSADAP